MTTVHRVPMMVNHSLQCKFVRNQHYVRIQRYEIYVQSNIIIHIVISVDNDGKAFRRLSDMRRLYLPCVLFATETSLVQFLFMP